MVDKYQLKQRPYCAFTMSRKPQGAQVFYDRDYLVQHLAQYFKVDQVIDRAYGFQSGYLLTHRHA